MVRGCGRADRLRSLRDARPEVSDAARSGWVSIGPNGEHRRRWEQCDFTAQYDGWAVLSGTSSTAPQIAGASALILSAKPGLKPAQIIEALSRTALDILHGQSSSPFNQTAGPGFDNATGWGLINASAPSRTPCTISKLGSATYSHTRFILEPPMSALGQKRTLLTAWESCQNFCGSRNQFNGIDGSARRARCCR